MLSLEDLAAIRIAVELSNIFQIKNEILCAPGSDYERCKSHKQDDNIKQWHQMVENKTRDIMKNLCDKQLLGKVEGHVISIGMKMVKWIAYHEGFLGLTREFSIMFLNSSLFTSQGTIDNKKTAEELLKDKSLSIKQKYKLACLYCLTEHVPDLYRQMSQEDKEECSEDYSHYIAENSPLLIWQHEIVKFWSCYLKGEIDALRGEKTVDEYMLEVAVKSGSKGTVEYWLGNTDVRREDDAVIDAALKTVKNVMGGSEYWDVFLNHKYADARIPHDYFVDILCFLMSKMREDQLIEFLKRDIEDFAAFLNRYKQYFFQMFPEFQLPCVRSRVLEHLLSWPHQNYFMKTAKLTWEFLPERIYANLLLKICDKIDPSVEDLNYGEERIYDYRKLLREFWCQSPDRYKRFVITDKNHISKDNYESTLAKGTYITCLLQHLLTLRTFTYEDRKNIELILDSATDEEKESIILSEKGKYICIGLMKEERWEMVDEFVSNCLPSKEKAEEFKRGFSITEEPRRICINFMRDQKWDSAEFFIKWSLLAEKEIPLLKREMLYSNYGMHTCWQLFVDEGVEITYRFCGWFLSSEEEIEKFKKKLILWIDLVRCADLIIEEKLDVVDEFINWSLLSQEEIWEFKKELRNQRGNYICENLISKSEEKEMYDKKGHYRVSNEFKGGKWQEVEKYLTWCSLSDKGISDFKERFLKESGAKTHFNLIKCNQWGEAEKFFAWLQLSPEEIKELKKETLWNYNDDAVGDMISGIVCSLENDQRFSDDERRQEATERFLRWFLTDKKTVVEFKDLLKKRYKRKELTQDLHFESAIKRRLRELEEEQGKENVNRKEKCAII